MKSGWFWNSERWAEYQHHYYSDRDPVTEWKSSPLANDHDIGDVPDGYEIITRRTQVIDLSYPLETLWAGVRKSYHSIIHRANEEHCISEHSYGGIGFYQRLHAVACNGQPRCDETYRCQENWLRDGYGMLVMARAAMSGKFAAASYWIVYKNCAYYMSGPSIEKNVQHAVIWHSLELLKARGIMKAELGQIGGDTLKEMNIGKFKVGFGGHAEPFQIVRKA